MLGLAEEALLLFYVRKQAPGGVAEYDTLSRFGVDGRLLAGAVLMDLVLHGRVQVRTQPPSARLLRRIIAGLVFLMLAAVVLGLPSGVKLFGMQRVGVATAVLTVVGFLGAFAWVLLRDRLFTDRLTLVGGMPTGDRVLDEALQRLDAVGWQAPIITYLRLCFAPVKLPSMVTELIVDLELAGSVSLPVPGPTVFGLLDRRLVYRERPEFQAIGERVRRLTLDGTATDPRAVALLLLFAGSTQMRTFGGRQATSGIHQFFAPAEYARLRERMREIRRGDPAVAAQVGPDLYESLRAVAVAVEQLRRRDSASASGG